MFPPFAPFQCIFPCAFYRLLVSLRRLQVFRLFSPFECFLHFNPLHGVLSLCQRFRMFRSEVKWKGLQF